MGSSWQFWQNYPDHQVSRVKIWLRFFFLLHRWETSRRVGCRDESKMLVFFLIEYVSVSWKKLAHSVENVTVGWDNGVISMIIFLYRQEGTGVCLSIRWEEEGWLCDNRCDGDKHLESSFNWNLHSNIGNCKNSVNSDIILYSKQMGELLMLYVKLWFCS